MPSPAGQDSGYIPAEEKTMIFIPSKGGSHNPDESTEKKYIEETVYLMYAGIRELFKENQLMKRLKDFEVNSPKEEISLLPQAKEAEDITK